MAFGVVLFTLLVQATTMCPLIRRLQLAETGGGREDYELQRARQTSLRAAFQHLERLHAAGMLSAPTLEKIRPELRDQSQRLTESLRQMVAANPALGQAELAMADHEIRKVRREALWLMRRDGVIGDESFSTLFDEIENSATGPNVEAARDDNAD